MTLHSNSVIALWSPKGGSGTSVTAAVLALALAKRADTVLIDAAGDQSAIFGKDHADVGFNEWTVSGSDGALARLAVPVVQNLQLVSAGTEAQLPKPVSAERVRAAFPDSIVVVDLGRIATKTNGRAALASTADQSLMVLRPCYLSAQRALGCGVHRDGIVFIDEPGRVLRAKDLSEVLCSEIVATVELDPALARLVDAGRMTKRLPRSTKALDRLAQELFVGEVEDVS